jgi:hypothetical protein
MIIFSPVCMGFNVEDDLQVEGHTFLQDIIGEEKVPPFK